MALLDIGFSYGLSATLPPSGELQASFDIDSMMTFVDWFKVMDYDVYDVSLCYRPTC
jgi:GH18 family chitinase